MLEKRSYLLQSAKSVEMQTIASNYNPITQMNMMETDTEELPVVTQQWFITTGSKTAQAPGDDDPDPEDAGCY